MLRVRLAGMLWLLTFSTLAAQDPVPPKPAADAWPPPGVYLPSPEISPPMPLHRVQGRYTPAALRAKIQGSVEISGVVLADGTVGPARVTRSLDAVHGLDETALASFKQWRFAPARLKNGEAVPVLISMDMTFRIGGLDHPALSWPEGFSADRGSAEWSEDVAERGTLRVRIAYPPGWTLQKNGPKEELFLLRNGFIPTRSLSMAAPRDAPFPFLEPLPEFKLREFAELMKKSVPTPVGTLNIVKVGQVMSGRQFWLWVEADAPAVDVSSLPAAARPGAGLFEAAHVWMFTTTAGPHLLMLQSMLLFPKGITDESRRAALADAAAEIGTFVRRLVFEPR